MLRLRALQDETGGFQTFIPLAFHPDNNALMKLPGADRRRGSAHLRRVAPDAAQHPAHQGLLDHARASRPRRLALWFGADDLDGTVQEERIYHMAGRRDAAGADPGRDRCASSVERRAARRSSATRCYNVVAEGDALVPDKPVPARRAPRSAGGRVVKASIAGRGLRS